MTTGEDRQVLADRLIAAGGDPDEARRTAGLPSKAVASKSKPRKKRARRRKVPRLRVAPASSFGSLIAQMLGLVLLYWVIRSAGAVGEIFDRVGSGVRWLVQPVGWGQRPN